MPTDPAREEVFSLLVARMSDMFEVDPSSLTPDTHLFKDLDLDSIDAIDLAVHLQEHTGKKVEEEALRELKTVSDVVDLVLELQRQ